jgi:hypothetical protein
MNEKYVCESSLWEPLEGIRPAAPESPGYTMNSSGFLGTQGPSWEYLGTQRTPPIGTRKDPKRSSKVFCISPGLSGDSSNSKTALGVPGNSWVPPRESKRFPGIFQGRLVTLHFGAPLRTPAESEESFIDFNDPREHQGFLGACSWHKDPLQH